MKKRRHYVSRARALGRRAAGGAKGTAVAGVSGTVAYLAHKTASENVGFIRERWWAGPVAMLLMGHFLKRRPALSNAGVALCGAAGYAGGMGWDMSRAVKAQQRETSGWDTGALVSADPARQLPNTDAISPLGASSFAPESAEEPGDVSSAYALGF